MIVVDGYRVSVDYGSLKSWNLGYAVTTHCMQGSEAKVIIVNASANDRMFDFQWAYVAATRAKEILMIVGNLKEFQRCATRVRHQDAVTLLQQKIDGEMEVAA